ncbi:carboxypeptidase regulatory-like domain-containing protein [Granulicella arctica]|uniref:carboxypeptidase regulatory-like domain-containing protein n=1 Tax=Granulicella arctica TaxID=940613 RepID=UPI0032B19B3E
MKKIPIAQHRIVFRQIMGYSRLGCLLLFLLATLGKSYGQGGADGTILGTVTDNSGAVVPKASVEVTNVGTGVTQFTITNDSGEYSVPSLHPDQYRVSLKMSGFQASVATITLLVGQHARVDMALKPGQVADVVNVATSNTSLDTDTAEISQTISSHQVVDLPLNSRNFVSLLFLNSAAVMTGGESGGNSISAAKGSGAISIGGGRSSSNQYLIDGMYNNDSVYQTPAISPSIDAIQEFKTQSGAYSAEYGASVNQVNISFRSGTNQFHGTAFEFLRNDDLDARTFNAVNPSLKQNQFGYTLGGPIWIPKLYNGRNKSFFFANYEGLRIRQAATIQANVPTQAELGIGTPNGEALIPATDSFAFGGVGCAAPSASCTLSNPNNGYAPFAQDGNGNFVIPASDFSNFAVQVRGHLPAPNATRTAQQPHNYLSSLATPTVGDQQNYRFDQNIGTKNALFFRYSVANFAVTSAGIGLLLEGEDNSVSQQTSYVGGYTRTFTPNLINQFRFGYLNSINNLNGVPASPASLTALGIKGLYTLTSTPYAQVQFSSGLSNFGGAANNDPQISGQRTYDLADSVIISRGRHTLSAGIDLRWATLSGGGDANEGTFTFNGLFAGSQVADLMLGDLYTAGGAIPTPYSSQNPPGDYVNIHHWFLAPYVQDDWKVNSRLTINAGLRYDFNSVPYNQNNHYGWFQQEGPGYLVIADQTVASQLGAGIYKYAGGRTPFGAQKLVFAPRFGFAYRPTGNTVIRGGYGVFFDSSEDSETHQFGEFYPYSVRQNLTAAKGSALPLLSADQVFPAITTIGPVTASSLGFLLTQSNYKKDPYVQEWDLSIERQFGTAAQAEVSYVGNKGTHLLGRANVNQAFPYDPAAPTSYASRVPFANFGKDILVDAWNIPSNYNALNAKVQTNNTKGLTLIAAYTWSKSMDEKSAAAAVDGDAAGWAGPQNPHDFRADYSRSGYDVGQKFVAGFIYNLPIGKGMAVNLHGPVNTLLGGWQVNGILTFQGGFPFSVAATDSSGLNGDVFGERASLVGEINPAHFKKNAQHWFNNVTGATNGGNTNCLGNNLSGAAFCNPSVPNLNYTPNNSANGAQYLQGGQFGNTGRNIIRAPGIENLDSSLFKNFNFTERLNFQFRLESFNTLNKTQLGQPDPGINDGTFGVISTARIPGRIVQIGGKVIF